MTRSAASNLRHNPLGASLQLPCGTRLRNRIVKAAMSELLAQADGLPNELHGNLYHRFAEGGAGLLITGNVLVDGRHLERAGNVFFDPAQDGTARLRALGRWARSVGPDCALIMQLNHPGRQAPRLVTAEPVAPSAIPAVRRLRAFGKPRALTGEEIDALIGRFASAASLAEQAGFAGAQVHAAHGYLINQFLSPATNQRDDRWGGSLDNRARLLCEVMRAVRAATAPSFAIGVKLNSNDFQRGGFSEDEAELVGQMLAPLGCDFVEISGGTYERPVFGLERPASAREGHREAYFASFASRLRSTCNVPIILTGGFRSARGMREALASGVCDLVGLARPLVLETDLPSRLLSGEATGALEVRLQPPRLIAAEAEQAFYREQFERIARHKPPNLQRCATGAFMASVARDIARARARRRASRA